MPELDQDQMSAALAESSQHISNALADCLSPISGFNERTNVSDMTMEELSTLNFGQLVELQFAHQTKQALSGIRRSAISRTSGAQTTEHPPKASKTTGETQRQALLHRLNEVIKEQQERGVSTGAERGLQWRNPAPGGRDGVLDGNPQSSAAAGNMANAIETAMKLASKVC
jgi:hypothetical protein